VLLDREAGELHQQRFDGIFSPETVRAVVHDSLEQLAEHAPLTRICRYWPRGSPANAWKPPPRSKETP
jgi:hypothetical protein